MSFFDNNFPGVRGMLERERDASNAQDAQATANGCPWKVLSLNLGRPEVPVAVWAMRD